MSKDKPKNKGGRPSLYSEELIDEICVRLAQGQSMSKVCKSKDMPHIATVWRWLNEKQEFHDKYMRAKEEGAEADADRIEEIAEGVLTGEYGPQEARVAMDAYKWTAGKKKPKKYGERIQQDINVNDYTQMDEEELAETIKRLQGDISDEKELK
jgi:hypothetical protein